jgi:hypothetical protein
MSQNRLMQFAPQGQRVGEIVGLRPLPRFAAERGSGMSPAVQRFCAEQAALRADIARGVVQYPD